MTIIEQPQVPPEPDIWRRYALCGLPAAIVATVVLRALSMNETIAVAVGYAEGALLLASMGLLPLGVRLIVHSTPRKQWPLGLRLLVYVHPLTAFFPLSFVVAPGPLALLAALPSVLSTLCCALAGLERLRDRWRDWQEGGQAPLDSRSGSQTPAYLTATAALLMIAVGGGWLAMARVGYAPLNFGAVIVVLTATHFHYAAFALPVCASVAMKAAPRKRDPLVLISIVAGVLGLAAGITCTQLTGWPWLETATALIMAHAGLAVAMRQMSALRGVRGLARALIVISSLSLTAGMALAAMFGLNPVFERPILDIPTMLASHGALNAVGFGLCGLIGWNLALK
ncbi:MAG: YndJ family transporter [Planctomycetes bacterium]|nr:YndJ family transporter [Planctomycetota bacterium]